MPIPALPLFRHRDTVITPADQNQFVTQFETTMDTMSNDVIPAMNDAITDINGKTITVTTARDEAKGLLNQTKTYVDSVVSDANEALTNASEVKANTEQIDRLAYGLTQIPITMSAVIDGELIMYYNDPIQSLSLVDGDLIVNY